VAVLVIDIGSSAVRTALVEPGATLRGRRVVPTPPDQPFPGLVEVDAAAVARAALSAARATLEEAGPADAVGVTNQRGTSVVWDAETSEPVGPALSWQDLRTAGTCLELQAEGLRLAPNESATKLAWLLDTYDKERSRNLRFGTLDSWVIWNLTRGAAHVTDRSNAGITGLLPTEDVLAAKAALEWSPERLQRFSVPVEYMPKLVPSSGPIAPATALPGAPPVCGIVGDQQASLMGQGCIKPGDAKVTFGTGAFLDINIGSAPPCFGDKSGPRGSLPIVAWERAEGITWGVEGLVISAGSAVSWLVDDVGMLSNVAESAEVAAQCEDTGDVYYVPAQIGLGTPYWDFGARSLFVGMSAGTGRPQLVRAVLRGVAQRGADLLEAAEADSGHSVARLRADGGMTMNPVFVKELADACQRPVEISAEVETTSLGAAFLAGLAAGTWSSEQEVASLAIPRQIVEPGPDSHRERWKEAVSRAERWIPDLSALKF